MAITDIKDAQGFTENPVVPETPVSVSAASGDVPPPTASAPLAPKVTPVVPGEVLPNPESRTQSSSAQENVMGGVVDAIGGLVEALAPPEQEEEPVAAPLPSSVTPSIPNVEQDSDGGRPQSVLQGLSPEAYSHISPMNRNTSLPSAIPPAGVANERGYTSKLVQMVSGKAPEVSPQQKDTYLAGKSVQHATNAAGAGGSPLEIATAFLGADERDPESVRVLSAFFKESGGVDANPATTAWCAAFVNAVLGRAGLGGTGALNAQSFLNYGTAVDQPQIGDIVVFERGPKGGWQGHVGIVAGFEGDRLQVLGGNQSTSESAGRGVTVNINSFDTDRVLGYRRPTPPGAV